MTLQQCRYLIEIAKYNSITKAANELFVTQPSISKAIHELEADLNITIFERSNRGVSFTNEGLELLSYAKMLIAQEETIHYHFKQKTKSHIVNLSISSQHFSFATEAVARMIHFMNDRKYEFSFQEGKATDVIEHVSKGISMLGVISVSSLNREFLERSFAEQSLVFTSLETLTEHVFLNKTHPLASCKTIQPEQLAEYPCLTYRKNDTPLEIAEDYFNIKNTSQIIFVQDRGSMDELLVHTNGYNLGTGCMSKGYISPEMISIPLAVPWQIHIGYIRKSNQVLSKEIMQFIEYLSEALKAAMPER